MYEDIKDKMVEVCRKMWQKGWVAANDGNVTVKVGENRFLATRTGISKWRAPSIISSIYAGIP